jgi:hypothetical protein
MRWGKIQVTNTSETPSQTEQVEPAAPSKRSSRKSIVALSVLALAINGTAAIYTLPSSFEIPLPNVSLSLPDISRLAELLPHEKVSAPKPDPVVVALTDIQSAQQQHAAALQDALQANGSSLQQNTALLQHDSTALLELRQSVTDEKVDIKKISVQLSALTAKVDLLQSSIAPEITSSIPKGRARNRLSAMPHKRWARSLKPFGPVSVGGAPLTTTPAQGFGTQQSPEG